jgi:hypothetical protein
MRALWLAAAAVLAVACASTPVPSSDAIPVPEHRIFAKEFTTPQEGYAYVVVTRDKGLIAEACAVSLFVDGTHVADLSNREQIRLFVKTGEHLLGISAKGCFRGSDQLSIDATQDKLTLLRIEVGLADGLRIKPSAF